MIKRRSRFETSLGKAALIRPKKRGIYNTQVCRLNLACQKIQSACAKENPTIRKTQNIKKNPVIVITAHKNCFMVFF